MYVRALKVVYFGFILNLELQIGNLQSSFCGSFGYHIQLVSRDPIQLIQVRQSSGIVELLTLLWD